MNNASGHIHHGVVDPGTAETGAVAAAWASPCPTAASAAGAAGAGSFDANTVPAAVSMAKTTISITETFKQRCTISCPFFPMSSIASLKIIHCVMQLHGFNLHGLSCYYNDGEVVKKNVNVLRWNSINSYDEPIRNTYDEEQKKWRGLMPRLKRNILKRRNEI
jgi:hypothetical protein